MAWLTQPFTIGLGIGLILAAVIWIQSWLKRRDLIKDITRLKDHLHTQMEISAKGNDSTKSELETVKKQTENLRITVATLKAKPGRAELRTLHVYDKVIHMMYEKAPGFASAWESMLKEADQEIQQTDTGFLPLMRKVFRPSLPQESPSTTATSDPPHGGQPDSQVIDVDTESKGG